MGLKLVSEDLVSHHKLDKLAVFHHIILLIIFSSIIGFGIFCYQKLSQRLTFLERKAWDEHTERRDGE